MTKLVLLIILIVGLCHLCDGLIHGHVRQHCSTLVDDNGATPTPTGMPEHWFHQKLDHFDPSDERYWNQRYFVYDNFYKPGGAAFLNIGGEGGTEEIEGRTGAWLEYAKVYSAIGYTLEHRYYGKSQPTVDVSTKNLQYLTMEQALEDLAAFITYVNEAHNLTDTKWIVFGGSYAGMLAAWMRYKFPHLVAGAVAHSATIGMPVDNSAYAVGMGEALHTVPGCYKSVSDAFDEIRTKLKTEAGVKELMYDFQVCYFDRNNPLDVEYFMWNVLFSSLIQVIQYNGDDMGYLLGGSVMTVSDMCSVLTNSTFGTPLDRLAYYGAYLSYNYYYLNGSCFPTTFSSRLSQALYLDYDNNTDLLSSRQWNYQLCTQLGNMVTTNTGHDPFGKALSTSFFVKTCEGYFGSDFNMSRIVRGNDELVMRYDGLNIKATNIVYTQGSFDPFRKIGVNTDNIPGSHVIVIQGVGHVADSLAPSPQDSNELKQARAKIQRYIGQFLTTGHVGLVG